LFAGWDQGIVGMCIGEKRKLKIPSHMGYGDQGSPPTIPGDKITYISEIPLVGARNICVKEIRWLEYI
jgi:FK506-binding protein 2